MNAREYFESKLQDISSTQPLQEQVSKLIYLVGELLSYIPFEKDN